MCSGLKKYRQISHTSVGEVSEQILMKTHVNYSVKGPTFSYWLKIPSANKLKRDNVL